MMWSGIDEQDVTTAEEGFPTRQTKHGRYGVRSRYEKWALPWLFQQPRTSVMHPKKKCASELRPRCHPTTQISKNRRKLRLAGSHPHMEGILHTTPHLHQLTNYCKHLGRGQTANLSSWCQCEHVPSWGPRIWVPLGSKHSFQTVHCWSMVTASYVDSQKLAGPRLWISKPPTVHAT